MTKHEPFDVPFTNVPLPVKLTSRDFLMLNDAGAFAAYGKTELLDGEIVYMNAQHRPHARAKMVMYDALRDALRSAGLPLTVLVEVSVALSTLDTPEPDLLVTSEPDGDGPVPGDSVSLVIEISDATIRNDLVRKPGIYARGGIPEYWVIDLDHRRIHQMWSPAGEAFAEKAEIAFGDALTSTTIAGLTIDTSGL